MKIITREDAINQNLKFYYTGKTCRRGHTAKRWVSSRSCSECQLITGKKHYKENREKILTRSKKYNKSNKEAVYKYAKKWRTNNVDKIHTIHLRRKYGEHFNYDMMLTQQNGMCAICGGSPQPGRRLHVDHNHDENGKIRGLLCGNCNRGIGLFKDNPVNLTAAAKYIINHNNRKN